MHRITIFCTVLIIKKPSLHCPVISVCYWKVIALIATVGLALEYDRTWKKKLEEGNDKNFPSGVSIGLK